MAGASDLTKFQLVMWKNWLLVCRNKKSTFWTIALPLLSIGLLVLCRAYIPREQIAHQTYPLVGLAHHP